MIYLKNNTEKQTIFIPRNELQKEAYITTIRTYEDGLKEGYGNGIEDQKDQLLNLYVTENGVYEREDGYGKITVDILNECKLENLGMITYTSNGVYTLTPSEGYDGISEVKVDVFVPKEANLQRKEVELDKAILFVKPDNGYDGLKSVNINAVPLAQNEYNKGYEDGKNESGSCNLEDKIIAPQTNEVDGVGYIYVYPSEGYDGMKEVALYTNILKDGWYNEGYEQGKLECNLEIKDITPNTSDFDENGWMYVYPTEGYNGMERVAIQQYSMKEEWYNQGYEQGRAEGGGGGECNIQSQKIIDLNSNWEVCYPDEGYDGIYEVVVDANRKAEEWREEGRQDVKDRLQTIEITENGRYSVDDQIYVESLRYNGGYHTDTISTYDINRIEVTFKAETNESINGQGQPFILGGSLYGVEEVYGTDNACARAIQYAYGRIVGYWEGKWTDAAETLDGEWLTITLTENGMTVKYPSYERYCEYTHNNGNTNGGGDIFPFIIGGLGDRKDSEDGNYSANLVEDTQFRGLIKEVKINTNSIGEITYIPKNWGYGVWDRKVENTGEYLSSLEPTEGEVTINGEWENIYGEGWREINVNTSFNLQDKWVTPSMAEKDENGLIVVEEDEGYDGLNRVVIDPNTIYKEGYDSGRDFTDYRPFMSYTLAQLTPSPIYVEDSVAVDNKSVDILNLYPTLYYKDTEELTYGYIRLIQFPLDENTQNDLIKLTFTEGVDGNAENCYFYLLRTLILYSGSNISFAYSKMPLLQNIVLNGNVSLNLYGVSLPSNGTLWIRSDEITDENLENITTKLGSGWEVKELTNEMEYLIIG